VRVCKPVRVCQLVRVCVCACVCVCVCVQACAACMEVMEMKNDAEIREGCRLAVEISGTRLEM